jgi:hypothetical protein
MEHTMPSKTGQYSADDFAPDTPHTPAAGKGQYSASDFADDAPPQPAPAPAPQSFWTRGLQAVKSNLQQQEDLVKGIGETAAQNVASVGETVGKIPGIGQYIAPDAETKYYQKLADPANKDQAIGKGATNLAENVAAMALAPEIELPEAEAAAKVIPRVLKGTTNAGKQFLISKGQGGSDTDAAVSGLTAGVLGAGSKQALEEAGENRINKVVRPTKADEGYNLGKGYFQARLGPSMSMGSIARKAEDASQGFGDRIGEALDQGTGSGVKIPIDNSVQGPIYEPIRNALNVLGGPGGNEAAKKPVTDFWKTFFPSIEAAQGDGGFTPRGLFDLKRNVALNTPWTDATQPGLKQVRQQMVGKIGDVIADNVPELRDLNSGFRNTLKLAERAGDRATTGSQALPSIAKDAVGNVLLGSSHPGFGAAFKLLNSIPVQTSLATAQHAAGGLLPTLQRYVPAVVNAGFGTFRRHLDDDDAPQ